MNVDIEKILIKKLQELEKRCSDSEQKIEKLEKRLEAVKSTADMAYLGMGLK